MAGSRWSRLADRRAVTLLGAVRTPTTSILLAPGGFPMAGLALPPPCDVMIDPSRPEEPGDHAARLRAMIDACAPDGRLALVACGGSPTGDGALAPRGWAAVRATLVAAGFEVALVPFDVLGPRSPWRLGLGARRDRVLTELDAHLAAPSVRAAARLVETHVTAALAPEQTGRVFVAARRGGPPMPAPPPWPAAFDAAMRPLLHDDAVVRWLAFVDAELLAPSGVTTDLLRWLRAAPPGAVHDLLRSRGRWWHPDLEAQRLAEAAAHRLAGRTMEALAPAPYGELAPTLEYDLVAAFNTAIGRCLDDEPCPGR